MSRNKTKGNPNQLQQGDVTFELVPMPAGARLAQKGGQIVLAEGESTGHKHVIESEDAELYKEGERMLLNLAKQETVVHDDHRAFTIPAAPEGMVWEVGGVREWDWAAEMSRRVAD